jgi:pimeloyl-ACP methyl ester carboxylesterase
LTVFIVVSPLRSIVQAGVSTPPSLTRRLRRADFDRWEILPNTMSLGEPMKTTAFVLSLLLSAAMPAQEPRTGYAPVNGLKMYYEIHGKGDPVVLLHGSFMTITNNWTDMIPSLSKSRRVIAVEMQGHGRTADINRDFSYEALADDIAALLDYLKVKRADVLGYSMGGGVAMQVAIRHPEKVRKVISISAVFRHDGWVKEAVEMFPQLEAGMFKGSPIETEYMKLSPTPDRFATFVKRVIQMDLEPYDFSAAKLKATKAPFFFIHGDADGVRLEHISEMFRLKGGDVFGDMRPRSESRLAILPDTTHITLMNKTDVIVPMVNDFLNAPPQKK